MAATILNQPTWFSPIGHDTATAVEQEEIDRELCGDPDETAWQDFLSQYDDKGVRS